MHRASENQGLLGRREFWAEDAVDAKTLRQGLVKARRHWLE